MDVARKPDNVPPLFQTTASSPSTSSLAGQQAALNSGSWRRRILEHLEQRPSALFEVATHFGVPDHTISGRFTELARDGYIERTGERRRKPETDCDAEVWRIRRAGVDGKDLAELLGYPLTLLIDGEAYDRQPLLPAEGYPAIPYARRADTGGVRQVVRVELVECPGCGKPLKMVPAADGKTKTYRCGNARCNRTWHPALVRDAGQPQLLALVMRTF